jgi:hypothetical protein
VSIGTVQEPLLRIGKQDGEGGSFGVFEIDLNSVTAVVGYSDVGDDGGGAQLVAPFVESRLAVHMVTHGAVDRAVLGWIADECSRSTVKTSLAILVRVMDRRCEMAYRP